MRGSVPGHDLQAGGSSTKRSSLVTCSTRAKFEHPQATSRSWAERPKLFSAVPARHAPGRSRPPSSAVPQRWRRCRSRTLSRFHHGSPAPLRRLDLGSCGLRRRQFFGCADDRRCESRLTADSFDVWSHHGVCDVRTVPRHQEIKTVDSRDGDVRCINCRLLRHCSGAQQSTRDQLSFGLRKEWRAPPAIVSAGSLWRRAGSKEADSWEPVPSTSAQSPRQCPRRPACSSAAKHSSPTPGSSLKQEPNRRPRRAARGTDRCERAKA